MTLDIQDRIRRFIQGRFANARHRRLGDHDHLLDQGVLDSLGVLDVVAFLEEEFGVVLDDEELTPEHFRSIATLTALVVSKSNGHFGA
jgi:acyl carrier protein